jgi:hypothetical protein
MKKILLLLAVLNIQLAVNSQLVVVPNNTTFSLQDVYAAIQFHSNSVTGDLSSCFSNAIPQFFDPTYNQVGYAPANSMLRFRNYGPKYTQTFTSSGSWTNSVSGTLKAVVLCWGPGGSGGCGLNSTNFYGGGGGGGGGFIKALMDVAVGNSYSYLVGAGGGASYNGSNGQAGTSRTDFTAATQFIAAQPGQGGMSYSGGRTGGAGGGTSTGGITALNSYNGGNGATAPLNGASPYSGGGGGGAGTTGAGNNGSGATGGAAKSIDGGVGGNGSVVASGNGISGGVSGGGGGGSTQSGVSGPGVAGKIIIYY